MDAKNSKKKSKDSSSDNIAFGDSSLFGDALDTPDEEDEDSTSRAPTYFPDGNLFTGLGSGLADSSVQSTQSNQFHSIDSFGDTPTAGYFGGPLFDQISANTAKNARGQHGDAERAMPPESDLVRQMSAQVDAIVDSDSDTETVGHGENQIPNAPLGDRDNPFQSQFVDFNFPGYIYGNRDPNSSQLPQAQDPSLGYPPLDPNQQYYFSQYPQYQNYSNWETQNAPLGLRNRRTTLPTAPLPGGELDFVDPAVVSAIPSAPASTQSTQPQDPAQGAPAVNRSGEFSQYRTPLDPHTIQNQPGLPAGESGPEFIFNDPAVITSSHNSHPSQLSTPGRPSGHEFIAKLFDTGKETADRSSPIPIKQQSTANSSAAANDLLSMLGLAKPGPSHLSSSLPASHFMSVVEKQQAHPVDATSVQQVQRPGLISPNIANVGNSGLSPQVHTSSNLSPPHSGQDTNLPDTSRPPPHLANQFGSPNNMRMVGNPQQMQQMVAPQMMMQARGMPGQMPPPNPRFPLQMQFPGGPGVPFQMRSGVPMNNHPPPFNIPPPININPQIFARLPTQQQMLIRMQNHDHMVGMQWLQQMQMGMQAMRLGGPNASQTNQLIMRPILPMVRNNAAALANKQRQMQLRPGLLPNPMPSSPGLVMPPSMQAQFSGRAPINMLSSGASFTLLPLPINMAITGPNFRRFALAQAQATAEHNAARSHSPQSARKREKKYDTPNEYYLMTFTDRDFIVKIQLRQMKTENPFADDYYFRHWLQLRTRENQEEGAGPAQKSTAEKRSMHLMLEVEPESRRDYIPRVMEGVLGGQISVVKHLRPRTMISLSQEPAPAASSSPSVGTGVPGSSSSGEEDSASVTKAKDDGTTRSKDSLDVTPSASRKIKAESNTSTVALAAQTASPSTVHAGISVEKTLRINCLREIEACYAIWLDIEETSFSIENYIPPSEESDKSSTENADFPSPNEELLEIEMKTKVALLHERLTQNPYTIYSPSPQIGLNTILQIRKGCGLVGKSLGFMNLEQLVDTLFNITLASLQPPMRGVVISEASAHTNLPLLLFQSMRDTINSILLPTACSFFQRLLDYARSDLASLRPPAIPPPQLFLHIIKDQLQASILITLLHRIVLQSDSDSEQVQQAKILVRSVLLEIGRALAEQFTQTTRHRSQLVFPTHLALLNGQDRSAGTSSLGASASANANTTQGQVPEPGSWPHILLTWLTMHCSQPTPHPNLEDHGNQEVESEHIERAMKVIRSILLLP